MAAISVTLRWLVPMMVLSLAISPCRAHIVINSLDGPVNGAATYAGFNERCCSTQTDDYLPAGFIFLTPFNTDIFKPGATADVNSGHVKGGGGIAAGILWGQGLDLQARRLRHQQQLRRVWPRRTATRGGGVLV